MTMRTYALLALLLLAAPAFAQEDSAATMTEPVIGIRDMKHLRTGSLALRDTLIRVDSVRWDDLVAPAILSRLPSAGSATLNEDSLTVDFSASATNTAYFVFQLSNSTVQDTAYDLNLHIHWVRRDTGSIVWQATYQVLNIGDVPGIWGVSVASSEVFTYEGKALHQITSLLTIPSERVRVSSVIKVKLARLGGDGGDTYPLVARVVSVDVHYPTDGHGSKYETSRY